MDPDTLFSLANATALVGWALLVLLPGWRWSARFVGPVLVPTLLAVLYAVLLLPRIVGADGRFGSLDEVRRLFDVPELLLAGWLHYLAFDLFVGSWEVRDAQRLGVPHLLLLPCLALTFLLGPVGLALYLGLRGTKRRLVVEDAVA